MRPPPGSGQKERVDEVLESLTRRAFANKIVEVAIGRLSFD
jgi:hypothetical protein